MPLVGRTAQRWTPLRREDEKLFTEELVMQNMIVVFFEEVWD